MGEEGTKGIMNRNHFESNQRYFTICIYTVFVILAACVIFRVVFRWDTTVAMIKNFLSNMSGFIVGILIAFIVSPLVNVMYNKVLLGVLHRKRGKKSRIMAIFLSYLIVLGLLAVCLVYIIPQLISSLSELSGSIPMMYTAFSDWIREASEEFTFLDRSVVNTFINNLYPKIMELSANMASEMIPWMYSVSLAVIQWIITIVIALVVSVYLLADKQRIFRALKRAAFAFLPENLVDSLIVIVRNCNAIFTSYVTAQALDALIVGILCFLLMSLLRLPYALLISVIVAATNMVPYFGPYIGAVPGICILAALRLQYGIMFAVMIFVLQQFDGWILAPRILGDSTGLRPILILFAITFGGAYLGVFGLFLGVPAVAVLQYLLNLLIARRIQKKRALEKNGEILPEEEKQRR